MAGIFKKSKKLEDVLEKQMELNGQIGDKLKIAERSLSEYQRFLDFIDEKVEKNGWQLYGVKKHKDDEYIAYFLESKLEEEPQYRYNYNIYAYLSSNLDTSAYKAYLGWCFKERFTVGRVLHIDNHYVTSESLQGQGIGTESMNIIKALARQLQCDGIQGTRKALNYAETEEERKIEEEKLYKFYEKNGFIQSREHRGIFLPLKKSVREKFLKNEENKE